MLTSKMFCEDLIDLSIDVNDEQELFDFVGMITYKKGVSRLGYISSLEKRESAYPTGLQFPMITLALPHVDSKYVNKPFIFVGKTKKNLKIKQMGDSKDLKTNYFLFLGIKNGKDQPKLLANLMQSFQNENFVKEFVKKDSKCEMYSFLVKNII
ncbi:MAG: PTS sugar transporter subunit IIA [Liquorilactobacillus ghanensis]|uniref:PTS sugar transporter subunit IIA n=1 Tax=Liquorilactobacillus ghanensis TaxID=399370 RepID=UPI0039E7304B